MSHLPKGLVYPRIDAFLNTSYIQTYDRSQLRSAPDPERDLRETEFDLRVAREKILNLTRSLEAAQRQAEANMALYRAAKKQGSEAALLIHDLTAKMTSINLRGKSLEAQVRDHEHLQVKWVSLQHEAGQLREENRSLRELIRTLEEAGTTVEKDQKILSLEVMLVQRNQAIHDLQEELARFQDDEVVEDADEVEEELPTG